MKHNNQKLTGKFVLPDGRSVFGNVYINGSNSKVVLFDDDNLFIVPGDLNYLTGQLYDGRKITLLQCLIKSTTCSDIDPGNKTNSKKYSIHIFPHYIAIGAHLPYDETCVSEITFSLQDASSVFYEFDSFGMVLNTTPFIELLKHDKSHIRPVDIGDSPIIGYFTGNFDIAEVETGLGKVKVYHQPSHTLGGVQGWKIDNKVIVSLTSTSLLSFDDSIGSLNVLIRFFELLIGKVQPLNSLYMKIGEGSKNLGSEVYRSYSPEDHEKINIEDRDIPGPSDVLISTAYKGNDFASILKSYIKSDSARIEGRARLRTGLNMGRLYTVDRLISAANLFDLFPNSLYPKKASSSAVIKEAKAKAKQLFRELPASTERNSFLEALGRIDRMSLRQKVNYRVRTSNLLEYFEEIDKVLQKAIMCRNHFVHGSDENYALYEEFVPFFTDCLEFVFGVSDLVDIGWDYSTWLKNCSGNSHPYGQFIVNYSYKLQYFNKAFST